MVRWFRQTGLATTTAAVTAKMVVTVMLVMLHCVLIHSASTDDLATLPADSSSRDASSLQKVSDVHSTGAQYGTEVTQSDEHSRSSDALTSQSDVPNFVITRGNKKGQGKVSRKSSTYARVTPVRTEKVRRGTQQGESTQINTQTTRSAELMLASQHLTDDMSTVLTTTEMSTTSTTTTRRPLVLGDTCRSPSDCQKNINRSTCASGVCVCAEGYFKIETRCYAEPRNLRVTQRNDSVNISWEGDNIEHTVYINISNKYNTTFKMFEVTGTQLDFSPIHPGSVIEVMVSVWGSNSSTGTASVTIAPSSPERLNITFVNDTCMEAEWSPGTGVTEQYTVYVMHLGTSIGYVTTQTTWSYCGLPPGEQFNVSVYARSNSVLSRVPAFAFDYTNPSKPRDGRLQYISLTNTWRVDIWWSSGSNKDKEFVVTVENRTDINPSVVTPSGPRYTSHIHISYGSRFTISIQAVKHGKKSSPLQITGCTAPGTVEGLTVVSSGYNWIELEWSPPAGDVDSFEYEVTVQKHRSRDRVDVTDTLSYRLGNLTPGTNYSLTVRVKFCNLTSDYTTVSGATSLEEPRNLTVTQRNNSVNIAWEGDNIEYTVYINISNKYNTTFKMFEVTGTQVDFSPIHPGSVIEVMVSVSGSNSSTGTANVTIAPSSPERLNITFVNDACMEAEWSPGTGVTEQYTVYVMHLGTTIGYVTTQTTWSYCGLPPGEQFNVSVYARSNSVLSRVPAFAFDYTNPSKPRDGRLQYISLTNTSRVDISWIPGSNKDKEFVVTVENRTDIKPTEPSHWGSRYLSRIHISYGSRFTINIQAVKHGKKSSPLQMTGCTAPGTVEGLTVVSSGYNWIELEWSPPAGDVDSFEYDVTVHKPGSPDRVHVTNKLSYRVDNLTPGTNYSLKVRVKFCNLTSDYTTVSGATSLEEPRNLTVTQRNNSVNISWFGDNIEHTVYINISNKYNTTFKMFEVTGTQVDFSPIHPGSVIEVMVSVSGSNSSTGTANVTIAPSSPERLNITFVNDTCMEAEWSPGTGVTEQYQVYVMYLGTTIGYVTTQTTWSYCGLPPGEQFKMSVYAMSNSVLSRVPASVSDYTNPSKPRDGRLQYISLTNTSRVDISWIPGSNRDKEFVVTVENRTDIKPTEPSHWGSWYLSRIHISYGSRFTINIQAVKHGKKSSPLQITGCTAPGRVEGLTVVSSGYNWIELEWSPPAGDVDSFEYEVTVHKPGSRDRVHVIDTISYRVDSLTPGTNHTLKVRVKFCNLTSDYTTVSGKTSLEGLSKFEVHPSLDSPALNIVWEHPLRDKGGLAFLLTVSENNETVIYNQNITQSPLSVSVNSFGKCFLVTLLVTGTSRSIPVSQWISTPEKTPGPVVDLSSSRLTQDRTSLNISWSRPEVTNGIITEYRLSVNGTPGGNYLQTLTCQGHHCKLHCGNKHRMRKATVQGGSTSYFSGDEKHFSVLVANLSQYENYDIRVTASTSQFTGSDVLLRTDDQLLDAVENFSGRAHNASCLALDWDYPTNGNSSDVLQFVLRYRKNFNTSLETTEPGYTSSTSSTTDTSLLLCGLDYFTNYTLSIAAVNKEGEGRVQEKYFQTAEFENETSHRDVPTSST